MLAWHVLKSRDWPRIYSGFSQNKACALLSISSASLHYCHQCCSHCRMVRGRKQHPDTHLFSAALLWALPLASTTFPEFPVRDHVFHWHQQTCAAFSPPNCLYIFLLSHEQRLHRSRFTGFGHSRSLLGQVRYLWLPFLFTAWDSSLSLSRFDNIACWFALWVLRLEACYNYL